ncbi:MAG: hypothetical protein MI863_01250, partial [Desulfobacterales bacterium]|nr:hypothetical protein [Desulfobacterales bacterium]
LFLFYIVALLLSNLSVGLAGNPFTTKPEKNNKVMTSPVKSEYLIKIVFWQHQLREKMSNLMREVKSEKKIIPVFLLTVFAFFYGVIHSAGPGHGKAVALSYILTCKPKISQSLIFGNLVALTHGFSGIILVLIVKFILDASITKSLETTIYATRIISYSLVSMMGVFLFLKGLKSWFRKASVANQTQARLFTGPFATALVVGLIPCPGVVMVMLFAISLNLTCLGILLGTCIAAGMATTITVVVLAGMSGKSLILKLSDRQKKLRAILENSIETIAGFVVAALGLILMLANL